MEFKIKQKDETKITVENERIIDGVTYFDVVMTSDTPVVPQKFSVTWAFENHNVFSVWKPKSSANVRMVRPNWSKQWQESRLASWMPVIQANAVDGKNTATIALSDAMTPTRVGLGAAEMPAELEATVEFFTEPVDPIDTYRATVRFDTRKVAFYDALYDVASWWETDCGYGTAHVPAAAKDAVNSLWYSYHQKLEPDEIVRQCVLSKALGMDTVIIDDGWQTADVNRGYKFCGDWELCPEKIPSMKELCDRLHEIGVKVVLWYSVPYMGVGAKNFDRFKDMLLDDPHKSGWASLDPRFKEVREYLKDIYKNALVNYGLDGFKLDFIDAFRLTPLSMEYDERRDCASLESAVDTLMSEVNAELRAINPDIMLEFRQSYVGPCIRKYGNMLRVADCPNDSYANRMRMLDLRLTSGKTAVHSDMVMWNYSENVEAAALQMANILYCVPQVSVRFDEIPEDHRKMVEFYLKLWNDNRDILLDGRLEMENPESYYSRAWAHDGKKAIVSLYTKPIIDGEFENVIAVNASPSASVIVKGYKGKKYRVVNCMGEDLCEGVFENALSEIEMPLCSVVYID